MKPNARFFRNFLYLSLLLSLAATVCAAGSLEKGFLEPPASARPWVYWFWLNGNLTSNGITADLEAMQRAGIGGVLIMEVDQGAPKGQAPFGSPVWRQLFQHVCAEAHRLGLQVNMNNDAGWCGSGGPWITPELSMQKVVWSETNIEGPCHFESVLREPEKTAHYYEDIAVLAFPAPAGNARLEGIQAKAAFTPDFVAPRAEFPAVPSEQTIPVEKIIDLTARLAPDGRLDWPAPVGQWTILRFGHTSTGVENHPAPEAGLGLETDKLSRKATEAMFNGLMAKVIADSKPLAGKTLVRTHIDSWETGSQNWTPRFREEFRSRRGYDLQPFLPTLTGRVVGSSEISERFLWDVRQTVSDLVRENYAGYFRELSHRHGIQLSIEAYTTCPTEELAYAGEADEPMGEFWSWPKYMEAFSCTEMTSAGHVYGKKIVGAESFTATDAEKWQGYPGNIKDLGDWAFCEGINRFVFHRYAMQPWTQGARPGMSMGPWGLHYERTETWWEQSAAWHQYLARCQFLLQQGLFVADLCLLSPEGSPQTIDRQESFISKLPGSEGQPLDRPGHNFDLCPPEVVLNRMSVRDGKLLLPDGMSYRLLALPQCDTMTPALLRKIKELVKEGATIAGARPLQSPSLSGYPGCDQELKSLAAELWGTEEIKAEVAERTYGKGRILCGTQFEQARELNRRPPGEVSAAKWVWKNEGNPAVAAPVGPRYFRKLVKIEGGAIKSAQLVMTADNSFQCWINGQPAARGEDFNRLYHADVARLLHPGTNLLTVTGVNGGDQPNPAGILGQLTVQFQDGSKMIISTDTSWEAASNVNGDWRKDFAVDNHWSPALELGAVGMAPWGNPEKADAGRNLYPDLAFLGQLLGERGLPEDFSYVAQSGEPCLRFIHKRIGKTEIYFVANKTPRRQKASCSFRVIGKRPELWWPEHGEIQRQAQYNATADGIQMPLRLESCESVFVVFQDRAESNPIVSATRDGEPAWVALDRTTRHKFAACIAQAGHYALTAENGKKAQFDVAPLSAPWSIEGPWQVEFAGGSSGPGRAIFQSLGSWSDQTDPAVKYFSGTATYTRTFAAPAQLLGRDRRLFLDLGKVAVIADVSLNGQKLGTLWNAPYRVEITGAIKPGENTLSVKVANLWINRQIGDELLPEDSDRNANGTLKQWPEWLQTGGVSPTGRQSFTSWRLWKRNDPLQESGLLGPVRIVSAQAIEIKPEDFH